jgi:hypothetical protein
MSTHKDVLGEHAQLDVLLRDLRAVSHWNAELLREKQVRMKLVRDLQFLKVRLVQHFETEESGSYMEEIRSRKPAAGDILKALQVQHPIFLEQISFIEAACEAEDVETDGCNDLLHKLSLLLDLIKLHEEEENVLIKEVFQR